MHASYLARHWRGELSLARSYWINTVLVSWPLNLVMLGATALGSGPTLSDAPRAMAATMAAALLAAQFVAPWQYVGVWRSARRHAGPEAKRLWPRLAQSVAVVALLFQMIALFATGPTLWHLGRLAVGVDDLPAGEIRVVAGGRTIELSGLIGFGMADQLDEALEAYPEARVLRLSSRGGRLSEAFRLRDLVAARGMTTYTADHCLSACTLVFLAGRERVLHHAATLGFHRVGLPGVWSWIFVAQNEVVGRVMRGAGVAPAFVARATSTPHQDLWEPLPEELLAAGVVTRLSDGAEFLDVGPAAAITRASTLDDTHCSPAARACSGG